MDNDITNINTSVGRLLRVIFINCYSKGKVHVLDIDNSTILTGHNGSGKTTLMGGIAPFFGIKLSAIAKAHTGATKSFLDFYLPHSNSYIIYEYNRSGRDLACVLLSRNLGRTHSGDKAKYNFINSPYKEDLFFSNNGESVNINNFAAVRESAKASNIFISKDVSRLEYEAIISNCPNRQLALSIHNKKAHRTIRDLRHDFALSADDGTFYGFAPIVSNVLESKLEFEQICQFLITAMMRKKILTDESIQLKDVDPNSGNFIIQRKMWEQFEALKPSFEKLKQLLSSNYHQQNILHQRIDSSKNISSTLKVFLQDCQSQIQTLENECKQSKQQHEEIKSQWLNQKQRLENSISNNKAELNRLNSMKDGFINGDVKHQSLASLKSQIENIPNLEETKQQYSEQRQNLFEQNKEKQNNIENIEQNYKAALSTANSKLKSGIATLDSELQQSTNGFLQQEIEIGKTHHQKRQDARNNFDSKKTDIDHSIHQIKTKITTTQWQIDNCSISQSFKDQIKELENQIQDKYKQQERLVDQEKEIRLDLEELNRKIHLSISDRERLNHTISGYEQEKVMIRKLYQSSSIMNFINMSAADGVVDQERVDIIHKTLNPELLKRDDLNPSWIHQDEEGLLASTSSFFGLSIETGVIAPANNLKTQQEITGKLIDLDEKILDAQSKIADIKASEPGLQSQKNKLDESMRINAAEYQNTIKQVQEHTQRKDELGLSAEDDRQERITGLQAELSNLSGLLADKVSELKTLEENYTQEIDKLDDDQVTQLKALSSQRTELEIKINNKKEKVQFTHDKEVEDASREKASAIESEGLDGQAIIRIEQQISDISKKIGACHSAKRRIGDYEYFIKNTYPKHQECEASIAQDEKLLNQKGREYKTNSQTIQTRIDDLSKQIGSMVNKTKRFDDIHNRLETTLKKAVSSDALLVSGGDNQESDGSSDILLSIDTDLFAGCIENIESNIQSLINSVKDANKTSREGIELTSSIKKPFDKYFNILESLYSDNPIINTRTDDRNWFMQAQQYIKYMDNEHEMRKDIIIHHYKNQAHILLEFKTRLDETHQRLNSFAKDINSKCKHMCDSLTALAIERFEMGIHSSIKDNLWYASLQAFEDAYHEWDNHHVTNPMPSDKLLTAFDHVHNSIGSSHLRIALNKQFSMSIKIKQHGQDEQIAEKSTTFGILSSNGTMRIAQLIIYLSLLSLINTSEKSQLKLFIDEIGVLDHKNTQELVQLLNSQSLTAMCAAPEKVHDDVLPLFDNNIQCSRSHKNVYSLAQISELITLTNKSKMQADGLFNL